MNKNPKGVTMNWKKVVKNITYLLLSNVIVRFISAVTAVLIARTLGVNDYGVLSVSLAFATVAGYFTDIGLTHTLMREATKKKANVPILISSFFRARMVLAFITIIISIILIEIIYKDPYLKKILYLVVLPTILGAAFQGVGVAYYQVIEKMQYTAIIQTFAGLTTSFSLILGIIYNWPLIIIGPIYGLANILSGIISLVMVTRSVSIFKGWDKSILFGLTSFTLSGFSIMLLPQIGPLILEKVSTFKEVGFFSAAYRIPAVLYQLPGIVAGAFYPILFRFGNEKQYEKHLQLNTIQLKLMSFLGVLLAIPFLLYSKWWVSLLFGEKWLPASHTLSILSIVVIIQSINYPIADALTTLRNQKKRMIIMLSGLVVGIPLYYFLGDSFGSIGAGIAAVIIELFLLICFVSQHPKGISLLFNGFVFNACGLTFTLIVHYILILKLNPLFGNVIAVIIFTGTVFVLDRNLRRKCVLWFQKQISSV